MKGPEEFIRDFQGETAYRPEAMPAGPSGERAPLYKSYPEAPVVNLEMPAPEERAQLFETIESRRSARLFSGEALSISEISLLVWAAGGITEGDGKRALRAAPSAGAQYPVETYLAVNCGEGLDAGLYHFNVRDFTLEMLRCGAVGKEIADACLGQKFMATCSAAFIWTGIYKRMLWRYGKRGLRYIYMDAGHIGENVHLAATALGLGCCAVGAFYDDEVAAILGLEGKDEFPIYLSAVGRRG